MVLYLFLLLAFLTDEGKTNFNVFFGGKESMRVKSVKIKVRFKTNFIMQHYTW